MSEYCKLLHRLIKCVSRFVFSVISMKEKNIYKLNATQKGSQRHMALSGWNFLLKSANHKSALAPFGKIGEGKVGHFLFSASFNARYNTSL